VLKEVHNYKSGGELRFSTRLNEEAPEIELALI
jgi:hypothetical protein